MENYKGLLPVILVLIVICLLIVTLLGLFLKYLNRSMFNLGTKVRGKLFKDEQEDIDKTDFIV